MGTGTYDRYYGIMVKEQEYGCFSVTFELRFREVHGNTVKSVAERVRKILEENCEHN